MPLERQHPNHVRLEELVDLVERDLRAACAERLRRGRDEVDDVEVAGDVRLRVMRLNHGRASPADDEGEAAGDEHREQSGGEPARALPVDARSHVRRADQAQQERHCQPNEHVADNRRLGDVRREHDERRERDADDEQACPPAVPLDERRRAVVVRRVLGAPANRDEREQQRGAGGEEPASVDDDGRVQVVRQVIPSGDHPELARPQRSFVRGEVAADVVRRERLKLRRQRRQHHHRGQRSGEHRIDQTRPHTGSSPKQQGGHEPHPKADAEIRQEDGSCEAGHAADDADDEAGAP